jgi:hypothetical protein
MDLTKQVCTLEQATRLEELGIEQKSLFYWNLPKSEFHPEHVHYGWTSEAIASAFTVAELGLMLPMQLDTLGMYISARVLSSQGEWESTFYNFHPEADNKIGYSVISETEAECRAALLIKLLENELITIESVNKNLQK